MQLAAHIAGIPCLIDVDYCDVQPGLGPSADSDWDCYGSTDIGFTVLDRKGYPAKWLERKMTDKDVSEIECQILKEYPHDDY